MNFILVKKAN